MPFAPEKKVTSRMQGAALRRGMFFYPASGMAGKIGGDAMMITPPFTIGDAEIEHIIVCARGALDEIYPSL
jgi:adenosylmethionine-8-amino-7-oxononanoate aminotransferase